MQCSLRFCGVLQKRSQSGTRQAYYDPLVSRSNMDVSTYPCLTFGTTRDEKYWTLREKS
jgi:hypothetical protein